MVSMIVSPFRAITTTFSWLALYQSSSNTPFLLFSNSLFGTSWFVSQIGNGYFPGGEDRKSTRLNSSHSQISYAVFCLIPPPPRSTLFPYTTLFRSYIGEQGDGLNDRITFPGYYYHFFLAGPVPEFIKYPIPSFFKFVIRYLLVREPDREWIFPGRGRSEEHTSELQSQSNLVCRLLLDTATSEIYTLSLHDALPILYRRTG